MELGSESVAPISLKFNGQDISKTQSKFVDGADGQDAVLREPWRRGLGTPSQRPRHCRPHGSRYTRRARKTGKIPRFKEKDHNTAAYLHAIVEALRIAFADASWWVTDPSVRKSQRTNSSQKPTSRNEQSSSTPHKALPPLDHGSPAHNHSDTVYFAVTDAHGNGISFINSNYAGFGSGIIPKGCGFTLQNRGSNFNLEPEHPNVLAPGKRPYHTIIPAMITNIHDGSLHSVYGVMGGFMQPQGHVQVLLNMLAFKMNPQAALDAPRVLYRRWDAGSGQGARYDGVLWKRVLVRRCLRAESDGPSG